MMMRLLHKLWLHKKRVFKGGWMIRQNVILPDWIFLKKSEFFGTVFQLSSCSLRLTGEFRMFSDLGDKIRRPTTALGLLGTSAMTVLPWEPLLPALRACWTRRYLIFGWYFSPFGDRMMMDCCPGDDRTTVVGESLIPAEGESLRQLDGDGGMMGEGR